MTVVERIAITDEVLSVQLEQKVASAAAALASSVTTTDTSENSLVETNFSDSLLNSKTLPYMQKYNALEQEMERLRRKQQELMQRAANCKDSEEGAQFQKQIEKLSTQIKECQNDLDVLILDMQSATYTTSSTADILSNVSGIGNVGNIGNVDPISNVVSGQINGNGFSILTGLGSAIVDVAKRYLGYNESDGSYHLFTNGGDYAWCAAFVTYVVKQAYQEMGKTIPSDFGSASVSTLMNWGINNNLFLQTAGLSSSQKASTIASNVKAGDIVIFKSDGMSHTGIVQSVNSDGSFTTVEGNTSDQVKVRSYKATASTVTGFISMA
jgi:hypothetical protein